MDLNPFTRGPLQWAQRVSCLVVHNLLHLLATASGDLNLTVHHAVGGVCWHIGAEARVCAIVKRVYIVVCSGDELAGTQTPGGKGEKGGSRGERGGWLQGWGRERWGEGGSLFT